MKKQKIILGILISFTISCYKETEFKLYPSYDKTFLLGTQSFPEELKPYLIGVYHSSGSATGIGNHFVLKWSENKLSLFSNLNGIYAVMDVGVNYSDSTIKIAGYWKSPLVSDDGIIYLTISKEDGARDILNKKFTVSKLKGQNINSAGRVSDIDIVFERFFSNKVLNNLNFLIIAHRGGGRNSDYIPYAENSLELVKHAFEMGANGVEIDVKLTKDNVPIIYHDDDINIRLTQKGPVVGNIEDFNYDFLKRYVRLVDGQTVPTMEEMLNTIVDSTALQFVWLDNKGGNERFFNYTLPIMHKSIQKAKGKNKATLIINGIPTEEVAVAFLNINKNNKDRPSLCEISLSKTKELSSIVYAPKWTRGTLDAEVADAHANNIKVISWTIDLYSVMRKYLSVGNYDGILTNYPSVLAYEFYTQE